MASDSEKRKLTELRVVDLRSELEKRDLDKNGVKAVLIERLEKILREEGHDPEEYLFDSSEKKTPMKRITKRGEQDTDENHDQSDMEEDIKDESFTDGDTKEDVKIEIDPKKEPEEMLKSSEGEQKKAEPIESETSVKTPMTNTEDEVNVKKESEKSKTVSENTVTAESEKNDGKHTKESEKTDLDGIKSTGKTDSEPSKNSSKSIEKVDEVKSTTDQLTDTTNSNNEVDKQKLDIQSNKDADKDTPEANGVDNEDSINLTIGEDDEKLLAEEEESSQEKDSKDEGGVHKKERAGHGQDKQSTTVGEDKVKSQEEEGKASADKSKSGAAGTNDHKGLKDEKDKKKGGAPPAGSSRNLWVSGLSSSTRATDLKQVFSKYGKVIGAKVVTNARTPGARCYGYVTMATSEDASKCIQYLHRTELHGRMISVERAKGDSTGPPRKSESKVPTKKVEEKKRHERKLSTTSGKGDDKKKEETEEKKEDKSETTEDVVIVDEVELKKEAEEDEAGEEKTGEDADKTEGSKTSPGEKLPTTRSREVSRDRKERERQRSVGSSHVSRPHSKSPHRIVKVAPRPGVLTFAQIREERERQRVREREREMREEERRRREEISRQRDLERRNREEAMKLEREKEKLRLERERIERDRAELIRLERERQRLEREKLEREREELKRQQLRLEEARRTAKRPAEDRRETYPDDRKRVAGERRFEGSSRFEERSNIFETKKDLKRPTDFNHRGGKYDNAIFDTTHSSRRDRDNLVGRHADVPRREHAAPDPPRGKDLFSRGKERMSNNLKNLKVINIFERPPSFRSRDDHRNESDHRSKLDVRHSRDRYPDSGKARVPGESRYTDRSGDTWHAGGGPVPAKTFGGGVPPRDSWAPGDRKPDVGQNWGRPIDVGGSDRWISGAGPLGVASRGPGMGGPGMYPGPGGVAPNIPGIAMGMSGGPYSGDRFDAYKQSMGPLRKY